MAINLKHKTIKQAQRKDIPTSSLWNESDDNNDDDDDGVIMMWQ